MKSKRAFDDNPALENSEYETVTENDVNEGKRKATKIDKERKREKNRLKRQRKKEKKKGTSVNSDSLVISRNQALDYLKLWKNDKTSWKFKKLTQAWLLKNIYKDEEVPSECFEILVEYLVGLKGEARSRLLKEAENVIESSGEDENVKIQRAKELIQMLE